MPYKLLILEMHITDASWPNLVYQHMQLSKRFSEQSPWFFFLLQMMICRWWLYNHLLVEPELTQQVKVFSIHNQMPATQPVLGR